MSNPIMFMIECKVNEGKIDAFNEARNTCVASTNNEAGCQNYDWFINNNDNTVIIYEAYENDAAFFTHLENVNKAGLPQLMESIDIQRVSVLSPVSAPVREAMDKFGAVYYTPIAQRNMATTPTA